MDTRVEYVCDLCGSRREERMRIGHPPASWSFHEGCGGRYVRQYGERFLDRQEDTVSAATQTMLYSTMPSGKTKAVI